MSNNPKVSIITVVYNGIAHLEQTIQSVIQQNYENIEYIIIDGGSTDGTVELIQKYDDRLAYWVSEADKGIYDAMNKGISRATGEIVGLINADDWYAPDAVEHVVQVFESSDAEVVHGSMKIIKEDGSSFTNKVHHDLSRLKKGMLLNHPTVFAKRKLYEQYGSFNTDYKIVADWEMMVRWWLDGVQFVSVEEQLASFRMGGVSSEQLKNSFIEKHRVRESLGFNTFIDWYYMYDLVKSVFPGQILLSISLIRQKQVR